MGEGSTSGATGTTGSATEVAETASPDTDPATTAVATMGGTGSTGADGDTTGMTATDDDGSDSSDDGSGSTGETGELPPGTYGPCGADLSCEVGSCFEFARYNMCLPNCGMDLSCRIPPDITSFPECIGAVGVRCMINCQDGGTCLDGTDCVEIPIGGGESVFRCLWPV